VRFREGFVDLRMAAKPIRRRCREAQVGPAVQLVTQVGLSLAEAARQLAVCTSGIAKAVVRSEQLRVR